jgi:hypothetical protein
MLIPNSERALVYLLFPPDISGQIGNIYLVNTDYTVEEVKMRKDLISAIYFTTQELEEQITPENFSEVTLTDDQILYLKSHIEELEVKGEDLTKIPILVNQIKNL